MKTQTTYHNTVQPTNPCSPSATHPFLELREDHRGLLPPRQLLLRPAILQLGLSFRGRVKSQSQNATEDPPNTSLRLGSHPAGRGRAGGGFGAHACWVP